MGLVRGHGGELALGALTPYGVDTLFTLSGGHIFPLYDAAVKAGDVRILDVRHHALDESSEIEDESAAMAAR